MMVGEMSDNGDREVIPRSEYEYPQEVRAEAVALALTCQSYADAAREMAKRYPERHPERDLIRLWVKKQDPENFRALTQERNERLYEHSVDLALLAGGKLEDEVEGGSITGKALAVTWGISMDKVHKTNELRQRYRESEANQALAEAIDRLADLSVPQLHDIIEGEATEIPPGDQDPAP